MDEFSLNKVLKLKQKNDSKLDYIVLYHYEKVQNHIKDAYKNYHEFCYYTVGDIEVKLPLYDSKKVAQLLVDYMLGLGWDCKLVYSTKIYIRWNPREKPKLHIPEILKIVQSRIEDFAKNNKDCMFYDIPLFINELPWYDPNDAAIEIGRILSSEGFIVKAYTHILYISWKKEELEYKSKIKIRFQTDEEKRREALEKINYINEQRYVDFVNPKKYNTQYNTK